MIEYLNGIVIGVLLLVVVALLRREHLGLHKITELTERLSNVFSFLENVLSFLSNLPKWLQYYNDLNGNVQKLKDRSDSLGSRLADLRLRVEDQEFQTGRTRKSEVDNWLNSAESKLTELQTVLHGANGGSNQLSGFLYRAWWGKIAEKMIQEVDDLYALGVFENVLLHARDTAELMVKPLVGNAASQNIETISTWLRNTEVSTIGVHGIRGVGKTALMKHLHNNLLSRGDARVYMVVIPEECTDREHYLQGRIAEAMGVDLQDEDDLRRASVLNRALKTRNFVLILDGLKRYFALENVGIPLDPTRWKMIVTSRSPDVCRRMGCRNYSVNVNPLSNAEALDLFKRELGVTSLPEPPIETVAMKIVEQSMGVPLKIIEVAGHLRGLDSLDDINQWQDILSK